MIKPRVIIFFCLTIFTSSLWALSISNHYSPKSRKRPYRKSTRFIILHTTEGESKGALGKLYKGGEAHYLITEKGHVYRIVHLNKVANHAGTSIWRGLTKINEHSIGVEVAGYHNQNITYKQYLALKELLTIIQNKYKIPDERVLTHSMVAYGSPNEWHKKSHRGRKKCGLIFAQNNVRHRLGLSKRPHYDPDVRLGKLIQADPLLGQALYSKGQAQIKAFNQFKQQDLIIVKGTSAWDIVGNKYNHSKTLYIFPNGKKLYGNHIKNWHQIPIGTKVKCLN